MTNTCSGCDATWTGTKIAHCRACCRTFSTVANFDRHRRDFACVDPTVVGMELRGQMWRMPPDERSQARLAALGALRQSAELADLVPSPQPATSNAHRANEGVDVGCVDRPVGRVEERAKADERWSS